MSGGISPFGMGLSGFGIARPDSQVIKSPEELQAEYQRKLVGLQDSISSMRADAGQQALAAGQAGVDMPIPAYGLMQTLREAPALYAQQQAQAAQAQNLAQQAYSQQTGGGFTGGLLNDTYSQPFSNVLGANMGGFTGGMMGQPTTNLGMGAGQAPAASTGLNPWMPQGSGSSPSIANSGAWGGPFGVKNPWSLS